MLRPFRVSACATALLLAATVSVPSASASAAPTSIPVVFVHGFFADECPGLNVRSSMSGPTSELANHGWTGALDVVSFYACDQGGSRIGEDTADTSIRRIGLQLAGYIYRKYTSQGQTVDIVGHSIGGLAARVAIKFTAAKARGFPPSLLVNRVVTFSAPYNGVERWAIRAIPGLRGTREAREVRIGSSFLTTLANRGNVAGTKWLVIGSSGHDCDVVRGASAVGVPHAIRLRYIGCYSHLWYLSDDTKTRSLRAYRNGILTTAYGPLKQMRLFLAKS